MNKIIKFCKMFLLKMKDTCSGSTFGRPVTAAGYLRSNEKIVSLIKII